MRRALEIFIQFTLATGHEHPHLQTAIGNYKGLLQELGRSEQDIEGQLTALGYPPTRQLPGK